jgi:hypothetical protein
MQVGTGSFLSSWVLMCVQVYASLHHVDGTTKQEHTLCFKMKSYQNYNCHTNHIVMENNQSYIIIIFTKHDTWGRCQSGTSFHLILYWNPAVSSTTAELAEDGVCIGSEWHSTTYKKLKVLCPIQMHEIEPLQKISPYHPNLKTVQFKQWQRTYT